MTRSPIFELLTLWQVDVFSTHPLAGNPAAVVFGSEVLDAAAMQAIARETNLSETVFLLPPVAGGDVRLRIFTTRREIPFAVHPVIAAAQAFAEASNRTDLELTLECGMNRVVVRRSGPLRQWHCMVPRVRFQPVDVTIDEVAAMLGLAPDQFASRRLEIAATGVPWLMIELKAEVDLDHLDPDHRRIAQATRRNKAVGVTVFAHTDRQMETIAAMRSFAPAEGIYEDPVCGSCAGSLAALLLRDEPSLAAMPGFFFDQGRQLARQGRVSVLQEEDRLWVGGGARTVIRGQLDLRENICLD